MTEPDLTRRSLVKIKDDVVYRKHQLDGIRNFLGKKSSFILGDDMGLGKTLQALTTAAIDFEQGWASRILVVAPATLKWNWVDEIALFTHFTCLVLDGTPTKRVNQLADFATGDIDVLIVNYEQVVAHLDVLNALGFDIIIYDEAHYMKSNMTKKKGGKFQLSKRTTACLALRGKRYFLLTGSPLLNQVNELWSLLHRIDPIAYPSYWSFVHRYCFFGGYENKQIKGAKNESELREKLQSVLLRRLKTEVLDLPKKSHIDIYVDIHPEQLKLVKQANDELKIHRPGMADLELANDMVKFLRIGAILSTTANVEGCEDHSFKLDEAVRRAEQIIASGRPVVIFTQFRPTLACLTTRLTKVGVDWRQLHGGVAMKERQPIVKAWSEDARRGRPQALLGMLQVAGTGLNMTAASDAIFADELFVPLLNVQAEDRLNRMGQDLPVSIHRIRVRNPNEVRRQKILGTKSDLNQRLVETDDWQKRLVLDLMVEDEEAAA